MRFHHKGAEVCRFHFWLIRAFSAVSVPLVLRCAFVRCAHVLHLRTRSLVNAMDFSLHGEKGKNIALLLLLMPGTLPGKEQRVPPSRCFIFALISGACQRQPDEHSPRLEVVFRALVAVCLMDD